MGKSSCPCLFPAYTIRHGQEDLPMPPQNSVPIYEMLYLVSIISEIFYIWGFFKNYLEMFDGVNYI